MFGASLFVTKQKIMHSQGWALILSSAPCNHLHLAKSGARFKKKKNRFKKYYFIYDTTPNILLY